MPNLKRMNARTSTSTVWVKRDRRKFMPESLQRQKERDEIGVLLRGQHSPEDRRHDALWKSRHRSRTRRIENLLHDVVGRLDLRDLREIGTDLRGAHLAGGVASDARSLAGEDRFTGFRIAGDLHLSRSASRSRSACGLRNVVELHVWRAALRLEKRGEGPQLGAVQRDRRLVDF